MDNHHEEKHCLVLITHFEFTNDPPQKCFPFLSRARERQRESCHLNCLCKMNEARDGDEGWAGHNEESNRPIS